MQSLGALQKELASEGIVVVPAREFLSDPSQLEKEWVAPQKPSGYKPFFCIENVECSISHDENLIGLIGGYYGKAPRLREVRLVQTIPTPGPAIRSQLWHRDPGEGKRILCFLYLNDVTLENSPFCYVLGTNITGRHAGVEPAKVENIAERNIRVTDAEMERSIPRSEWLAVTGPKHTLVIADTLGYHKGLKPVSGSRLALNFIYQDTKC